MMKQENKINTKVTFGLRSMMKTGCSNVYSKMDLTKNNLIETK
jgi:hypothetical protein